ncbi:DUF2786 domain-containing protein [Streptomyces kanamyceticus]|uniref:DUF2786 domain-containing protein n=1 Tax=Streptomyces kanamyceticus TaxID=1967 RepID=A0A5J6GFR4_STRKN|nr:DUF2786 domain-containing protein [Streptomyces kanamyceticus]QEU92781.1 DUF2786 domain-containing protein [Streptomyces kanamyceticus]
MDSVIDKAFAAALYGDGDEGLDAGASMLAAAPGADDELRGRGEEYLRRAWERGWQPADVVRVVRRDLAETHLNLTAALIHAETGRYPHLPPRWATQLADIGPGAERPQDRFSSATVHLQLYRLLLRLPPIEPVGPPPGGAVPGPVEGEPRTLTRIRALLAKAEATGFPEEAEALTAKAQELMARHSVDEALLAARTHAKNVPAACRVGVDAPYETAKAILLDAVASANRCRAVWNEALGFTTVVGFEPDLEAVELLYTSLLVQGTSAMTRAEAEQRAGGRKRTKTFRQSFLMAYAHRIGGRLATAGEHAVTEAAETSRDTALLPVLAARDVAVTDRAEQMFPETTTTRVRGATDGAGWTHGTAAADRAHVPGRGGRAPDADRSLGRGRGR